MKKFLSMLLAFLMILVPMAVRAEQIGDNNTSIDPEEIFAVQYDLICELYHGTEWLAMDNFGSQKFILTENIGFDKAMEDATAAADFDAAMAWINENGEYVATFTNDTIIQDPDGRNYLIRTSCLYASDGQSQCIPAVAKGIQMVGNVMLKDAQGNLTLLNTFESEVLTVANPTEFDDAYFDLQNSTINDLYDYLEAIADYPEDQPDLSKKYVFLEKEVTELLNNDGTYIYTRTLYVTAKDEEPAEDTPSAPSYSVVEDEDSTTTVNTLTYTEGSEEGLTVIVKDVNAEEDILTKDDLDSVYVDGKLVDPSNYDVETGCVIVTLHKDFLDTLGKGDHTVTINLKDGGKSTAGFSVKAADPTEEGTVPEDGKKPEENTTPEDGQTEPVVPQPETTVPKSDSTGSNNVVIILAAALALGCAVTLAASKKKENA